MTDSARREDIQIYSKGLDCRVKQVTFCLEMLEAQGERGNLGGTIDRDRAEFFCDTFWAWAWSALEILAQLVNQTENLGLSEDEVSFSRVCQEVANHVGMSRLLNDRAQRRAGW